MKKFLKITLLCFNVIILACTLFAAFGNHLDPAVWVVPAAAYMVFPIMLALTIVLLLLDLISWKKLAFAPAAVILLTASTIWSWCPMSLPHVHDEDLKPQGFKIMTYNVFEFMNYTDTLVTADGFPTLEIISDADADIILLQEYPHTYPEARWDADSTLGLQLRYPYRLATDSGMVIMSRYPMEEIPLTQPLDPSGDFLGARIAMGNDTLAVINVHLQSIRLTDTDKELYDGITRNGAVNTNTLKEARHTLLSKLGYAFRERASQARLLREQLDTLALGNRIIVAGDFNDLSNCWAMRHIKANDLHNTFDAVGRGPEITYWGHRLYFNIDHLLYGDGLKPLDIEHIYRRASDHYPVTATYMFK